MVASIIVELFKLSMYAGIAGLGIVIVLNLMDLALQAFAWILFQVILVIDKVVKIKRKI